MCSGLAKIFRQIASIREKTLSDTSRPFPSCPGPLFQNEGRCSAFDMEIIFHSHANKTHFQKKGWHLASFWKWGSLELGSGLFCITSSCNLRWGVLFSQKGRKSADGKRDENFPFGLPYKKGRRKAWLQVIPVDVRRSKTPLLVWNHLFGSCFCERDGAQRSIAFLPIILIFLTNKTSSRIYSVVICEQKNKGQCTVREFRMINSQLHCCSYQLWCLPSFATPDLLLVTNVCSDY